MYPPGPWDSEPDKVQWPDPDTGLPCLAVRHERMGFWCGYVGLAEGHPYFGKGYDDVPVEVHGGLTFADACHPGKSEAYGICHVPAAGEPDHVWWLGFDCGHAYDASPSDYQRAVENKHQWPWAVSADEEYRTLAYVREQCAQLARQLKEVA